MISHRLFRILVAQHIRHILRHEPRLAVAIDDGADALVFKREDFQLCSHKNLPVKTTIPTRQNVQNGISSPLSQSIVGAPTRITVAPAKTRFASSTVSPSA